MREQCPYKEDCLLQPEIVEVNGACDDARGEKCGPAAAYGMLKGQFGGLKDFDIYSPIVGICKIEQIPTIGDTPLEIREQWVGVELPVRLQGGPESGQIEVTKADGVLSLVSHGKLNAAIWFMVKESALDSPIDSWFFESLDGEVTEHEPTSSLDFYGSRLEPSVRAAIDAQAQGWQ